MPPREIKSPTRPKRSKTIQFVPHPHQHELSELEIYYTDHDLKGNITEECRICLEGIESGNRLITPCHCIGSVEYAHEECIKKWIEKLRKRNRTCEPISCELCQEIYVYDLIEEKQCDDWDQIKARIHSNTKIFLFLTFLFIITIAVTIYLIVLFSTIIQVNKENPKPIEIGVIGFSIVLLSVIASALLTMTIREFCYYSRKVVGNVMSMVNRKRKMSHFTEEPFSPSIRSKAKIIPILPEIQDLEGN